MASLTIISSPCLSPTVSLAFPRIVAGDSMIFHFATIGNITGMKKLLEDGKASPDDIKCDSGFTPLHYAVQSNRLDAARFLIRAKGNPSLHTVASRTALDYAVAKVLTQAAGEEVLDGLAELFKIHDAIEDKQFSSLHESVVGLGAISLPEVLSRDMLCVNETDIHGRTPISWAAERGNAEAVRLLIQNCADVNLADTGNTTPLHYAATSKSLECLDLLLDAGADTNAQDKDRAWTPLHFASFYQSNKKWVLHLLDYGADVHARTSNGNLPLVLAIMKGYDKAATVLIQYGADVSARINDGFTPLNSALLSNSTACIKVLLDADIDLAEVSWHRQTTLHLVASCAGEELMQCLMRADLSCLDPSATDDAGQTADKLLETRGATANERQAFVQLCCKILQDKRQSRFEATPTTSAQSSLENSLLFEDALEKFDDGVELLV